MSIPVTVEWAARQVGVQARTVRMWARRQHITIDGGTVDLLEVEDYWLNRRDTRMAQLRAQRDKTAEFV